MTAMSGYAALTRPTFMLMILGVIVVFRTVVAYFLAKEIEKKAAE